jgi:hypothetical protein
MDQETRISVQPTIKIMDKDHCSGNCHFWTMGGMCSLFSRKLDLDLPNNAWFRCRRCKMSEKKCSQIFGAGCVNGMLSERWMQKC